MARRGQDHAPERGPVVQPGLFDRPQAEPVAAPKAVKAVKESVRYAAYKGLERCGDCAQLVYEQLREQGGSTHLIRQARVRRVARSGESLLCTAHAQHRRESEAMPDSKRK